MLALNLEHRATTAQSFQPAPQVTPTRLLALLDKVKAFPLLKKQQPDAVAGTEAQTLGDKPLIADFNDYEIRIEEVFRFNSEDTLIFHVTLRSKSDREIRYLPESFCVRVGNRLYFQSIGDAPGVLPSRAGSTVYFAVTGTPDGGRNELSLKYDFTVLVTRTSPIPQPQGQSAEMTPEAEARARDVLRRAISDLENPSTQPYASPSSSSATNQPPSIP